jgi:hypothetical protein
VSDGSSSRLASRHSRRDAIGALAQEFAQGGCFAAAPGADGRLKPTKEQTRSIKTGRIKRAHAKDHPRTRGATGPDAAIAVSYPLSVVRGRVPLDQRSFSRAARSAAPASTADGHPGA